MNRCEVFDNLKTKGNDKKVICHADVACVMTLLRARSRVCHAGLWFWSPLNQISVLFFEVHLSVLEAVHSYQPFCSFVATEAAFTINLHMYQDQVPWMGVGGGGGKVCIEAFQQVVARLVFDKHN